MKPFRYVLADNLAHALALLAEHGTGAKVLAGGTDLIVELKQRIHHPDVVIDISRLTELKDIAVRDDGLHIGALATHADIMTAPAVRSLVPAIAEAAHSIGAVQTRNLGTLGGNLMSCVPSMDGGPTLLALEASVAVAGPSGRRRMALADLFVGPRKTSLAPDELLVDVIIPRDNLGKPAAFEKFGLRRGQALALVNAAASFWIEPGQSTFTSPRIALGAVAPTVKRAPNAEVYLVGRTVSADAMAEAGRIAAREAAPISDLRASADYRRELVAVLVKRALGAALARASAHPKELVVA